MCPCQSNHKQNKDMEPTTINATLPKFTEFPKVPRLNRECIVTEKIDGTNAQILITQVTPDNRDDYQVATWIDGLNNHWAMYAGSRTRWLKSGEDNFGWWAWVKEHAEELKALGEGSHFGEWWGRGIQRNYGIKDRRFSMFNVERWCLHGEEPKTTPTADPRFTRTQDVLPPCVGLLPVLYRGGIISNDALVEVLQALADNGSVAAPGFMNPEGIVVFHTAANKCFKMTLGNDGAKGQA